MKKIFLNIIMIIIFFSIGNTSNASGIFDNILNIDTKYEQLTLNLYELHNYKLKDKKYQKQFIYIQKYNPKIKLAILNQYKKNKFTYYQTQGLITHYNYFIYYTNKYFSALKNKEIYGNTNEIKDNISSSFLNMKESYIKFINLLIQKN